MLQALPLKALSIENVSHSYREHLAIKNISMSVESGEVFGLVGLNGAGKTTLMKSILGLLNSYQGDIKIFEYSAKMDCSRKKLAYLPEKFEAPWFLSGKEFIEFSCAFYDVDVTKETIEKAADALGLNVSYLSKRVNSYSKGMRQKLGLMSAFLSECPLIMLDEPMSGLDPKARIFVKDQISRAKAQGRTIFFSSHIMADVEELCDRIAIIHDKELRFIGKPSDMPSRKDGDSLEKSFLEFIEGDHS